MTVSHVRLKALFQDINYVHISPQLQLGLDCQKYIIKSKILKYTLHTVISLASATYLYFEHTVLACVSHPLPPISLDRIIP